MEEHPFILFCERYHIPYSIYKCGEKKGQIRLQPTRDKDMMEYFAARDALRKAGFERYLDHSAYYRDESGGTVVTFSPYWLMDDLPERIGEFEVEISPYPAYGVMCRTLIMRRVKSK